MAAAMKILVLGAGLVGGPMAADLARDPSFTVTVADRRADALATLAKTHRVSVVERDLSDARAVFTLAEAHDLVLSAVPGFLGYRTLEAILEAKKNVVDIAFFPEDALKLDALAKQKGVTALVDIGVAPGMSNVLAMHAHRSLDATESILTYVGGLPRVRRWPYEYAAVFSPIDVIEEYTRPARYVEHGQLVTRPALSDPELLDFEGVGTLEAFNTDGLRTMAQTMSVPNMKEKTLRYPGHIEKMAVLRETGLFRTEPVVVNGQSVRPIDVTAALLFPMWKLPPGEADVTVMRVIVEGTKDGQRTRVTWDLCDERDATTGVHSMARTTGYTATAAVRLLARGLFTQPGVIPPELLGEHPACVTHLLTELRERNVVYRERREPS
jgi:saccharopine dehydrogenase-like NADP-dependent oxidoreductase